jgi:hypothetical protein
MYGNKAISVPMEFLGLGLGLVKKLKGRAARVGNGNLGK